MTWESAPIPPGLPPGHGPNDVAPPPAAGLVPWEDPSAGSEPERFWKTIRDVFTAPGELFDRVGASEALGRPLVFGMIMAFIAQAANELHDVLFGSSIVALTRMLTGHSGAMPTPGGVSLRVGTAVGIVVFYPVLLLLSGGLTHGMLYLFGAANRPITVTIRSLAYASAVSVVAIVPFVGSIAAGIATIVIEIIGLARAHRASTGRVAAAVLLPSVILCVCLAAAAVALLGAFAATLRHI